MQALDSSSLDALFSALRDRGYTVIGPTVRDGAIVYGEIETDLGHIVAAHLDLSDDRLTRLCEQAIRNYDPCISCATHFLKLEIER